MSYTCENQLRSASVTVPVPNHFDSQFFENRFHQETPAVLVRNACKTFNTGEKALNNLNITVRRGTIYGLLGPSGCGKTTILSCIVGLKNLDDGIIEVFGHRPGSKASGIPGRTIGYMPQEIALYEVFTIAEMLQYFGRIYEMTQVEINARMEFLVNFLALPKSTSHIDTLSGGEKRRTSLAVAMMHKPELLLLDEPTVGVDPLVRENIWKHLCEMVKNSSTTIIITTHYIEEAKQFDTVGLMRNGRMITETSPLKLLNEHGTDILEDIVLKLYKKDNRAIDTCQQVDVPMQSSKISFRKSKETDIERDKVLPLSYKSNRNPVNIWQNGTVRNESQVISQSKSVFKRLRQSASSHSHKIRSLAIRNYLTLIRTRWFVLVIALIPAVQVTLGNFIVGRVPKNTAIGVVNYDVHSNNLLEFCNQIPGGCLSDNLSCKFLNRFEPDEIKWIPYSSEEEALENVENGNTWGFIIIPQNYTQHIRDRSLLRNFVTNETLDGTTIKFRLDLSFSLKSDFVISIMFERYLEFLEEIVSECGGDPRSVKVPLNYNAIYGSTSTGYREFLQPAQLLLTIFLLPMASSVVHLLDKKAGTMDRTRVAGVHDFHYIVAFMISEGALITVQLSICIAVLVFGFNFTISGSALLFGFMVFLQGLTGMSIGFLLGSFCSHELELMLSVVGLYILIMVASGVTWPIESLGQVGRIISYSLPTTLPVEALRSVTSRGWGIAHFRVWSAIGIMGIWIIGSCVFSAIVRRVRHQ